MKVKVPGVNEAEMTMYFKYIKNQITCSLTETYANIREKTFRGVAKCHPNDKYNKVIGERLALQKALMKRDKYIDNIIYDSTKMLIKLKIDGAKIASNKVERKWRHQKNRQDRSYKNTNVTKIG